MIDDADERLQFYSAKMVVARKDYRCHECGRTINFGEVHHSTSGKADGRVERYRTCAHCRVAGEWLEKEYGGYLIGGIQEDIWEHWLEGMYGFGLARLAVGMWRKWARFDGNGLMAILALPRLSAPETAGRRE